MKRSLHWPWALVLAAALGFGLWTGGVLKTTPKSDRPRVRFWQDSMHPWVKSDHPGTCPICAMDLTPIYEGGPESTNSSVVSLSKDAVTVLNLATEPVRRRDVTKILRVSGIVEAQESRTAMVSAPAIARVDALNVEHAGVAVTQGVWLVKLFSPDLAQRTRFLRAATSNRIAAVPPPDSMNHGTNRPGGRTADMPAETGNVNVPGIRLDLLSSDIAAPISGIVTDRSVSLGQFVMEGQRMITIVDPSIVWFRFDASDRQLAWIRQGQQIEVRTDALPGQRFRGSVSVIEPSVDDARRIARARAIITNSLQNGVAGSYALRLGSSADGRISVLIPGVLAVPRSAVLYPGSTAWVYLERGTGHYERRRVRLGREGDDWWEVLSGLNEGDSVVVSGNVLLDAQASFEQGGQSPDDETAAPVPPEPEDSFSPSSAPPPVPISDAIRSAIQSFLTAADRMASALAADDFAAYRKSAADAESAAHGLSAAAVESPLAEWMTAAANASFAARFNNARDLKEARNGFLGFGAASAGLGQQARRAGISTTLRIYQCPMAPKPGLWIQTNSPLSNPFFGAAMKRCGDELDAGISIPKWNPDPAAPTKPAAPKPPSVPITPKTSLAASSPPTNRTASVATSPRLRPTNSPAQRSTNTSTRAGLDHAERLYAAMSGRDELKNQMRARIIAEAASTPPPKPEVLTPTQIRVLTELLADIDAQGRALAAGNLQAFNQGLDQLARHENPMLIQLAAPPRWGPEMEGIRVLVATGPAPSLEQARARFEPFAQLSVKFARDLARRDPTFKSIRIFSSPLGDRPREWIQLSEPAANPFGAPNPKTTERTP